MVKVNNMHVDATLKAAQAAYTAKRNAEEHSRRYLGASSLGEGCARRLWYGFRGVPQPPVDDFAAIDDGHRGEDIIAERVNLLPGVTLLQVGEDGKQFAVSACGGHLKGHMDGAVLGLLQAPKTWHVFEAKVCNEKKFRKLKKLIAERGEKHALIEWDPVFYVQAQTYMYLTGMNRHWLVCATPGVRDWVGLRTELDSSFAAKQIDRAENIITSDEAPLRAADDDSKWVCKFCPFKGPCHGEEVPRPDCRNCLHSVVATDGEWACAKHGELRPECPDHIYLPDLIPYAERIDAHEEENWAEYQLPDGRIFKNGTRKTGSTIYSSKELAETDPALIQDSSIDTLRVQFGGEIEASGKVKEGWLPDQEVPF